MKITNAFLLTLLTITLSACSGSSANLEGQWKLVSYGSAFSQTTANQGVDTQIEFGSDGRMSGNVGCNGFGGDYKVSGNKITFGPVMSTMMFCEAVADQESKTLAVFQESANFVFDGNTLTITSLDGNSVIVLEQK